MDMVEIAVEELQFDLDLINLLFAEPAMEDGYVGDANGGSGGSSDSGNGDSKSASSDSKGGDDKKEKSDAAANDNKSDNKKDDKKDDEKDDGKKLKQVDFRKVDQGKINIVVHKVLDMINKKRDSDDKYDVKSGTKGTATEDGNLLIKMASAGNYKFFDVTVKVSSTKENDPSDPKAVITYTKDNEINDDDRQDLKSLGEDYIFKALANGDTKAEDLEIVKYVDNNRVAIVHNKKTGKTIKFIAGSSKNDTSTTELTPEEVKKYDVNKHRDPNAERGFGEKIESFFKMIWELIERAIAKIKEKLARCASGQKTFAKEIAKIQKEKKKPNMDIKVKNYIYNDSVIEKLGARVSEIFDEIKGAITEIKENADDNYDATDDDDKKWVAKMTENPFASIASAMGIDGEIGGAGDFFNAVRRMYRGSEDVVEFKLSSRPNELKIAENFVKSYDVEFNKILDKIDKTKKEFEPFKRTMDRLKNANKNKDNFAGMEKILNIIGKQYTVVINCYSFMASLLQERVYNCRNLFRRAYGAI